MFFTNQNQKPKTILKKGKYKKETKIKESQQKTQTKQTNENYRNKQSTN